MSKSLNGTKTHQNLKDAFAGESQANRRYLYFAKVADVEGLPEIAGNFKETADGETGHAHGHLDFLKPVGDPATGLPIGNTEKNLKSAIHGETHEYESMYPGMAKNAREEGFDDIAEWFETLAKAEKSHAGRFQRSPTFRLDSRAKQGKAGTAKVGGQRLGHPKLIDANKKASLGQSGLESPQVVTSARYKGEKP
jgi:rubrerythrin